MKSVEQYREERKIYFLEIEHPEEKEEVTFILRENNLKGRMS